MSAFPDLRTFIRFLERHDRLVRVEAPVEPRLEITEICTRLLAEGGPAVLFTNVVGHAMPLLANLFGTQERVALAVGRSLEQMEELGEFLARLRQPQPPRSPGEVVELLRTLSPVRHMRPRRISRPPCQEVILEGEEVDLGMLPVMTCWPGDAGPLITWPLVITQGREGGPVNLGVYRMQVIGRNRLIMRWLAHRGGAQHARERGGKLPVAVAIGADPATIVAAVTPIPETLSEYGFAGLLAGSRVAVARGVGVDLPVPAGAELVLEGEVDLNDTAPEGPFGDHTGYYNEVERFPVFTVHRLTMRKDPIYLSTFTGRPPDEPSVLALALNRVFVPLLRQQFPEIVAFHLPAEACSYRVAVISMRKAYPGHPFRVMTGVWGFLRQFLYTKYLIVVDHDVPVTDWGAVVGAMGRHVHAGRDLQTFTNTPIDYLDFASPQPGLGGKLGIDATGKGGVELDAVPGCPIPLGPLPEEWVERVRLQAPWVRRILMIPDTGFAVVVVEKERPGEGRGAAEAVFAALPPGAGADQVWVVDRDVNPRSWDDLWWAVATRSDPGRDLVVERACGRFAIDATTKLPAETERRWGEVLRMSPEVVERVDRRWGEYGLPGSGRAIWSRADPGE